MNTAKSRGIHFPCEHDLIFALQNYDGTVFPLYGNLASLDLRLNVNFGHHCFIEVADAKGVDISVMKHFLEDANIDE